MKYEKTREKSRISNQFQPADAGVPLIVPTVYVVYDLRRELFCPCALVLHCAEATVYGFERDATRELEGHAPYNMQGMCVANLFVANTSACYKFAR